MVALDSSIRLVALQFRFTNSSVIPFSVRHLDQESAEEYAHRKSRTDGFMFIEPTPKCSLVEFLRELEAAGYELVDAFYQERPYNVVKNPNGRWTYHVVRFLFARREFVELSDEFKKVRDIIRTELQSICESALWCAVAYSNPFYENGEEITDQRAVNINLTARLPLLCPDGQPVTVWQKDENGEHVGDAPLPLKPDRCLRINQGAIQLV